VSEPRTVLVVDDDAFIRRPLEFILQQEGFRALLAVDGNDCLDQLSDGARPDLIILDVMMPGRDGFEVCAELQQDPKFSSIPVIMLSARGRERDRDRGRELGAAQFFTKPYSPTELIRAVRDLLSDN